MNFVASLSRTSRKESNKSPNIEVGSVSSHGYGTPGMPFMLHPEQWHNVLTRDSLVKELEAASTSNAYPNYHYSAVLVLDRDSSGLPNPKPTRWRCPLCSSGQCIAPVSTILVPLFPHCPRSFVQHILGLDRPGNQAHGAILPVEQSGWSIGARLIATCVSFRFHSPSPDQGCQRPVSTLILKQLQ